MPAVYCVPTMCQPLAGYLIHTFYLIFTTVIDLRISILWKRTLSLRKVQECLQNKHFSVLTLTFPALF